MSLNIEDLKNGTHIVMEGGIPVGTLTPKSGALCFMSIGPSKVYYHDFCFMDFEEAELSLETCPKG